MGVEVMVDIETLGTGGNAAVISVGCAKIKDGEIESSFQLGITVESNQEAGRDIDAGTLMWWLDSDRDEARRRWLDLPKVTLTEAMMKFRDFCSEAEGIWGNGATFDNVILRSACAAVKVKYPVPFWKDKCYRTVKGLVPHIELVRIGTHHDAKDDAISQANHLIELAEYLGFDL